MLTVNLKPREALDASSHLHAVRSGDTRGVAHLVEAGADPDLQDASGLTAMDLASNQLRAARPSAC